MVCGKNGLIFDDLVDPCALSCKESTAENGCVICGVNPVDALTSIGANFRLSNMRILGVTGLLTESV